MEKEQKILETFIEEKEPIGEKISEVKEKPESLIRESLDFMRSCLAQDEIPAFREFWEAKQRCLELFKENIPSHSRTVFWQEYIDLMKQARTLKHILDEKSAFSEEQIRLAIQAITNDLDEQKNVLNHLEKQLFSEYATVLQNHQVKYANLQKEIDLLNLAAKKIKSLRDELIDIKIRIRIKNQFFSQLSEIGNQVFPRRKELIDTISHMFQQDIEMFISKNKDIEASAWFALKEDIKLLQTFAKEVTLNTTTFSMTREMLSILWNEIKLKEQSYKLEKAEKKEVYQKNLQLFLPKVDAFLQSIENKAISEQEIESKLDEILDESKTVELGKEEIKQLKIKIADCRKSLLQQIRQKKEQKQNEEREEKQIRLHKLHLLQEDIQSCLDRAEGLSLDILVEKWDFFLKQVQELAKEGMEFLFFQNFLAMLKDIIQEKKWVLWREEKDPDAKTKIAQLLEERLEERKKVKMTLESHRRIVGGSSLNLEMAMQYQRLIEDERARLDSMDIMIEEMEQKLFELEE